MYGNSVQNRASLLTGCEIEGDVGRGRMRLPFREVLDFAVAALESL